MNQHKQQMKLQKEQKKSNPTKKKNELRKNAKSIEIFFETRGHEGRLWQYIEACQSHRQQ